MIKIFFIFFFPLFVFSKTNTLTYFPLETYLINKIAKDEVKIREISRKYLDTYIPLPKSEISRLSNAKIFFHLGLDVEKKYAEILLKQNPNLVVIDLSENVNKIDNNPYIWTDPLNLRIIAKNLYDTFVKYDKSKENYYKENYKKFLDEIDQTFLKIKEKLDKCEVQNIYVFDDYWEYFAKRFIINTIRRDKRYLNISEIPQLIEFSKEKNINKLLSSDDVNQDFIISLTNNLNIKAIENDIFNDKWQTNLYELALNISNKN
jgi:zinc transport system substrate-binding protein